MFDIANVVSRIRLHYHANMLSVVNAANQLHILSDEKAEEINKRHCMTIFADIIPRLYGKDALIKLNDLIDEDD